MGQVYKYFCQTSWINDWFSFMGFLWVNPHYVWTGALEHALCVSVYIFTCVCMSEKAIGGQVSSDLFCHDKASALMWIINQTHVPRDGLCTKLIHMMTWSKHQNWGYTHAFDLFFLRGTAEYLKSEWKGRHESVTVMTACCWHNNQTFNHERAAFVFSLHFV